LRQCECRQHRAGEQHIAAAPHDLNSVNERPGQNSLPIRLGAENPHAPTPKRILRPDFDSQTRHK
jgi:hypothetical protein